MAGLSKSVSNLEKTLRASSGRSDKELFKEEGQQMQAVIRQLQETDKEGKRKAMGPVISLFCGEYLEARKAIWDGRGLKFQHEWEGMTAGDGEPAGSSSKGKAPERPAQRPPRIDLNEPPRREKIPVLQGAKTPAVKQPVASGSKTPAGQPIQPKAGSSKTPASSSKPPAASSSKKPAASSKPTTSTKPTITSSLKPVAASTSQSSAPTKTPATHAVKVRAAEDLFARDLILEQAPQAPAGKPSGEQKKIATKPPGDSDKTPAKPSQAGGKPAAGSSKTPAGGNQVSEGKQPLDLIPYFQGHNPGGETWSPTEKTYKAVGVTGREEHEHREASYDPAADSDSGGYEDKQVGEKQKGKPGQKGNKTKKPKSVPILGDTDSESDVPTIPRPPPKLPPTQKLL
ncbi:hypothetical protein EST38_g13236 [Candolleomyces aberdarensis]|uniref:Uncharacterized protein n=1 Tax=Candolleomyces aberdarensis TaxID=2316362 RepID=A0A4Q2D2C7_9AGAR|nr:hypothetical protein EST38_g13236 [Candolleomyces aberdarensis]